MNLEERSNEIRKKIVELQRELSDLEEKFESLAVNITKSTPGISTPSLQEKKNLPLREPRQGMGRGRGIMVRKYLEMSRRAPNAQD